MSLINQVLQDLEKRHASGGEARSLHGAVRVLPEPPRGRGWATLIVAGLVLTLGGAGGVWWLLPRQEATAARPAAPSPAAQVPATQLAAAHPPTGTSSAPPPQPSNVPAAEPILSGMPPQAMPAPDPAAVTPELRPLEPARPARAPVPKATRTPVARSAAAPDALESEAEPQVAGAAHEELVIVEEPASIDRQERWGSIHERAQAEFKRGMRLYQEGRAGEAEAAWRGALETDPANESTRHALLGLLLERGERAQAERLLQDGLRGNPAQSKLGLVLARLQLDRGALAEALQTLEAGLPHARQSVEYLTTTAAVMARAGRHGEAAALYQDALRIGPGNAVWYMGLGLALRADGRPRDALAAFQRARDMRALKPELQAFVERSVRELQ